MTHVKPRYTLALILLISLAVSCKGTNFLTDEEGTYFISAQADFTNSSTTQSYALPEKTPTTNSLESQTLQSLQDLTFKQPSIKLQLRNYNPASYGPRTRAVAQVRWYNTDIPLTGEIKIRIVDAQTGETLAADKTNTLNLLKTTGTSVLNTSYSPYLHDPNTRLCAFLEADLKAGEPENLGYVSLQFKNKTCEEQEIHTLSNTLQATKTKTITNLIIESEVQENAGKTRALIRFRALQDTNLTSIKLCLNTQNRTSCQRSKTINANLEQSAVIEFVTSYKDGISKQTMCSSLKIEGETVSACKSDISELLSDFKYQDGLRTNVSIYQENNKVKARVDFAIPTSITLESYSSDYQDYESQFLLQALNANTQAIKTSSQPVARTTGESSYTLTLNPLPTGASSYCYHLSVPYTLLSEGVNLLEMTGCS